MKRTLLLAAGTACLLAVGFGVAVAADTGSSVEVVTTPDRVVTIPGETYTFTVPTVTETVTVGAPTSTEATTQTTTTVPTTVATTTTPTSGTVNQTTSWTCTTPVDLSSVTITIGPSGSGDAVLLKKGCSGTIGAITIVQYHGDGLKIDGASNLTIVTIDVRCYAHDVGKHQDGVQVLGGGSNVQVDGGYVGCYSANNSQTWINPATSNGSGAVDVVFHNVTYDPAGLDSGQPEYTYGPGGAYGLANMASTDSGFSDSQLISNPNHHPCVTGAGAVDPVWTDDTFPAGDACP